VHKIPLPKQTMQSLDAPTSSLSLSHTSSDIRFRGGTRLSYAHTSQTTDSERIYSLAYYYKVGISCNTLKCHIISAALRLNHLETSLFPYMKLQF